MSDSIERVGIVGFGPMGQFVANEMLPGIEAVAFDPRITEKRIGNVAMTNMSEVAQSDAVIVAVPARHFESAVEELTRREMQEDTLVVDISSVKLFPTWVMKRFWGNGDSLLCHPVFGPDSFKKDGFEGKGLIFTEKSGDKAEELLRIWGRLGITIAEMTAAEHDKQMAEVHAKTFILGHLAHAAGSTPARFNPPSHKAVEMLESLDIAHSPELLESIVHFNPYVEEKMEKMHAELNRLRQPDADIAEMIAKNRMLAGHIEEMEERPVRSR